ncbi:MAG: hypothetical protein H6631_13135 [Anaerolineaceae bacterium]|nr:hypothetical protein [Anaerolineaceae bacterium]MCB9099153.1 hypothetical protein [Anaerolineales bacterium]
MTKPVITQEKHIHLSQDQADRLRNLAEVRQISEDQIIEKALDIMFSLGEIITEDVFWDKLDKGEIVPYSSRAGLEANLLNERQAEYRFKQDLVKLGLLEEIRNIDTSSPADDVAPVPLDGKPLSKMIIEERR